MIGRATDDRRPSVAGLLDQCCLVRNLPLAPLNSKYFKDVADNDGLRVIGVKER